MSDAISTVELTERAIAGGWTLPEGWKVFADITHDDAIVDLAKEYDCYSERQITAWRNDDWMFVFVSVWVEDNSGRQWGQFGIGGLEYGDVPGYEDDALDYSLNPLEDIPGEYAPIREHDMIGEALRDAVKALDEFGTPVLCEPAGTTMTGL